MAMKDDHNDETLDVELDMTQELQKLIAKKEDHRIIELREYLNESDSDLSESELEKYERDIDMSLPFNPVNELFILKRRRRKRRRRERIKERIARMATKKAQGDNGAFRGGYNPCTTLCLCGQAEIEGFCCSGRVNCYWDNLQLGGNIEYVMKNFLGRFTQLTELSISDNLLVEVPADINVLVNLKILDLAGNELELLPPEIGDLVNLVELDLEENYLWHLPLELGKLFNLEVLKIATNPLPDAIMDLHAEENGTQKLLTLFLDSLEFPLPIMALPYEECLEKQERTRMTHVQMESHQEMQEQIFITNLKLHKENLEKRPKGRSRRRQAEKSLALRIPRPASPSQSLCFPNWTIQNQLILGPRRGWIPLANSPAYPGPLLNFTLLNYNILCDKYATRNMYGYCPTWALDWNYRKKLIIQELEFYDSDIMTLQEVEVEQFYNFFIPKLAELGYAGIFAAKSRVKTMSSNEDKKLVDGCAIFYRTSKFKLLKEHVFEFNKLACDIKEDSEYITSRVMLKDNVGIAALFESRDEAWKNGKPEDERPPLLVCTAHIHWNPQFCDVKLVQTIMLMNQLKLIVQELIPSNANNDEDASVYDNVHLILSGDFNSLPQSGVIEFLKNSHVSTEHPDFKEFTYKDALTKLSSDDPDSGTYGHPFQLQSAYRVEFMPYTNYTHKFKGIIDYIFYTRLNMTTIGVLAPIFPDWIQTNKVAGCPHPLIPSDHFPMMAEFEMTSAMSNSPILRC